MKSKEYIKNPKVSFVKNFFIYVLKLFFGNELKHITKTDFIRIGKGLIAINLIFKKIFKYNNSAKFMVHFTSKVVLPDAIKIINDSPSVYLSFAVSQGCYFQAYNGIIFNEGCMFGPNVKFISADHDINERNLHKSSSEIYIGKSCWIGAGSIILPGVRLGDNVVVGAGSVVTRSVEPNKIVVGNPAKIIKSIPQN